MCNKNEKCQSFVYSFEFSSPECYILQSACPKVVSVKGGKWFIYVRQNVKESKQDEYLHVLLTHLPVLKLIPDDLVEICTTV